MNDSFDGLVGAVLCGGASRRMGTDKAAIAVDGQSLVERTVATLRAAGCAEVVVVGLADDIATTARRVDDQWPGEGPFGGVVTALEASRPAPYVAVVATDLPFVTPRTIRSLVAHLGDADADVAVARTSDIEPLCAVWRTVTVPYLRAAFLAGLRAVHGALGQLDCVDVDIDPDELINLNTPADLARITIASGHAGQ